MSAEPVSEGKSLGLHIKSYWWHGKLCSRVKGILNTWCPFQLDILRYFMTKMSPWKFPALIPHTFLWVQCCTGWSVPAWPESHTTVKTRVTDKGQIRIPSFSLRWKYQAHKSQTAQRNSKWKRFQLLMLIVSALPLLSWCISRRLGSKEKRKRKAQ